MADDKWEKCFQKKNLDFAEFHGYYDLIKEEKSGPSMYECF